MVRGGGIPFLPDGGVQREIVDPEPDLLYRSVDDATGKVAATLRSASRQRRLRESLSRSGMRYSADRFVREIRAIVADFG